jgi:hypothetical protein
LSIMPTPAAARTGREAGAGRDGAEGAAVGLGAAEGADGAAEAATGAADAGVAAATAAGAGILIVGEAVGFGGRLMRTVSFFGCTFEASAGFGGTSPEGGIGF